MSQPQKKTPKTPKTPPNREAADDDEDEGGEGGDGEGEGEEDPKDANRRFNAAITSRVKRELKPLQDTIAGLKTLVETLSKSREEEDEDDDQEESPPPAKKGKGSGSGESKKLSAMERRLKDAEDRATKAEQATKDQEAKAKRQEEDSTIIAALQKAGISDPKLARAALLSLRADEVITRDEETGKIRFKHVDKYGEDFVDPDVGIGKWIKGDGKVFIPAVQASGSGAGSVNSANPAAGSGLSKDQLSKLSKVERARIEIERASSGLPPLDA